MPGTTTTRNLTTLLTSDVVTSFASTINSVTTSVETELNRTVGFYNYLAASPSARAALTGMADGSVCFQTDTNEYWYYDLGATSWKLLSKPKTPFVPTVTNLGTGPTVNAYYTVANGICFYDIDIAISNITGLFTAAPTITLPITMATSASKGTSTVIYSNVSIPDYYTGIVTFPSSTTLTFWTIASALGRITRPLAATGNPFTEAWAAGDKITLSVAYAV
jgi:hypothetical protein